MTNYNRIQEVKRELLIVNEVAYEAKARAIDTIATIEGFCKSFEGGKFRNEFIESLCDWGLNKKRLSEKQAYFLAKYFVETVETNLELA